jgi:hypothetical protein
MTEPEASLIIRMHLALTDEGIGPKHPTETGGSDPAAEDSAVLAEAVRVAGHLFHPHWELWESGLVSDEVHIPGCHDHAHAVAP